MGSNVLAWTLSLSFPGFITSPHPTAYGHLSTHLVLLCPLGPAEVQGPPSPFGAGPNLLLFLKVRLVMMCLLSWDLKPEWLGTGSGGHTSLRRLLVLRADILNGCEPLKDILALTSRQGGTLRGSSRAGQPHPTGR